MVETRQRKRQGEAVQKAEESAAKKMKPTTESVVSASSSSSEGLTEKLYKGEMPSNQDIKQAIDTTQQALDDTNLSYQGKRLAADIQKLLDSSKSLLNKNRGDRLQKFISLANQFAEEVSQKGNTIAENIKDEQYEAMKDAQKLLNNVRDLVVFMIQSSDFRQVLGDMMEIFRNIAGEVTEQAKETASKSRGDVAKTARKAKQAIKLTDDQKKEIKHKFTQFVKQVSQNRQFNKAFNNLFNIYDHFQSALDKSQEQMVFKSENYDKMLNEAWEILGEWFGKDDVEKWKKDFTNLVKEVKTDQTTNNFFEDLRFYVSAAMRDPKNVAGAPMIRRGEELLDRAFDLLDSEKGKFKHRFSELFSNFQKLLDNALNDEDLQNFGASWSQLACDIFTDQYGKPDIYMTQESLVQLKNMLMPVIRDKLQSMPLPRIEGSNDTYDYYVEGMTFSGRDILPDHIHIRVLNDLKLDTSQEKQKDYLARTKIHINVDNILMTFENMKFYFKRKSFPQVEDYGTADVEIGGEGLQLKLTWELLTKTNAPLECSLKSVKCNIDELNITILDSNHDILNNVISSLFSGYIKNMVAEAIVDKIKESLGSVNDQLNDFFKKQHELMSRKMSELGDQLKEKSEKAVKTAKSWTSTWANK